MGQTAEQMQVDLANQMRNADLSENTRKYLSFMVDGDVYAFSALAIKEIIEYVNITGIPMVPSFVRGVTNLRGSVVPVIDLSARIGKRISPVTKRTCIVIVEARCDGEKIVIGVVIDAINEVFNLREEEIEAAPSFGAGIRSDFIDGMGKVSDKFVVLLNIDRVLSIPELAELIGQSSSHLDLSSSKQSVQKETSNRGDDTETDEEANP